ncbi:MAG: RIP metalloprotease [Alphaproteobacteria bacterium]|nr:RIP metalloprotease [Alphaproteobacteria bacterium]
MIYLLAFILVLSIVVVIHEGGHFVVARLCGVQVTDFSLGFGRELIAWTDRKGTRWKVCLFPLGGYVKMLGDSDAASGKASADSLTTEQKKRAFATQPVPKRMAIVAAGPAMNYIFAIMLLSGIFYFAGDIRIPPVIGQVAADSVAARAGLMPQDKIVAINGKAIDDFSDIQRAVRLTEFGKPLTIRVERAGAPVMVAAQPDYAQKGTPRLGITSQPDIVVVDKDFGIGQSVAKAARDVWWMTRDTLFYLKQIITNQRSPEDMRGPLGIAEASGDALRGGFLSLLVFLVQISVAVGFMNLLPIPLLDGGHLAFYLVEGARGKALSEKTQGALLWGGVSFLLAVVAWTFFLDVPRIVQRIFG